MFVDRRWALMFSFVVLLLSGVAHGQVLESVQFSKTAAPAVSTQAGKRPTFELPRAEPRKIDGDLTEACWQEPTAHLGRFKLGLSSTVARHSRQAWAAYDDANLYFAIKLQREPGTDLRAEVHTPDDPMVWEDDELEIFLDPFRTGTEYFQIIINSAGTVYDARHRYKTVLDPGGAGPTDTKLERETDATWSSGIVCGIAIKDDYWTVEAALPLAGIGLSGAPVGHAVHFNITSADWDTGEYTTLCPNSDWHDPKQLGAAVLGKTRLQVTSLRLEGVGAGKNSLRMSAQDLAATGGRYALTLEMTTGTDQITQSREFGLQPGATARVGIAFELEATKGPWQADVRILDDRHRPVFAARRSGNIPAPLSVGLRSRATFADGRPVLVAARVGLGSLTSRRIELVARLVDAHGRARAVQNLGRPTGAQMTAWMPVKGLAPGSYRLRLEAILGADTVAQAQAALQIGESPFNTDRRQSSEDDNHAN